MKKTLSLCLLLAALGAALLALAAPGGAAAPKAKIVKLKDDYFSPKKLTIKRGTKINFKWSGFNVHNVHVGKTHSKDKVKGSFAYTFHHKGKFKVYCSIHEDIGMKMTVTVK